MLKAFVVADCEDYVILACTVLIESHRRTRGRTDGRLCDKMKKWTKKVEWKPGI